jgi:antitoxin (DNA-binding transcriptional repressor) of toxin-antitoxin stability system
MPQPLRGADGKPIVVTEQDALMAGLGPAPRRGMFSGAPLTGRTASPEPMDAMDSRMRRQLRRNRENATRSFEDFMRTVPADD